MDSGLSKRLKALDATQRHQLAARLGIRSSAEELVAFVAIRNATSVDEIKKSLANKLPPHMIPRNLISVDTLPRTENGKIDYQNLASRGLDLKIDSAVAPMDEFEQRLARIWQDVLSVDTIGTEDNFFDLGGHSLLAMRLFSLIEQEFEKNLPLTTIFSRPTISSLADALRPRSKLVDNPYVVTLQKGRAAAPLFCIHAGGGNVFHYQQLATLLGEERPVLGIVPLGVDGVSKYHDSVDDMAQCYARWIVESYPSGPYLICGFSFGGSVAYEVSRSLKKMGHDVAYTGLFDTAVFGTLKISNRIAGHRQKLASLSIQKKSAYIARSALGNIRTFVRRTSDKLRQQSLLLPAKALVALGRSLPIKYQTTYLRYRFGNAMLDYIPGPYEGRLTVYRQEAGIWEYLDQSDLGWGQFVSSDNLEIVNLPGQHGEMLESPLVESLAESMREVLKRY